MVKSKKAKASQNIQKRYVLYIVIAGLILGLGLLWYTARQVADSAQRANTDKLIRVQTELIVDYRIDKLEFCHNNAIAPCVDEAITTWNNEHKDRAFKLIDDMDFLEIAQERVRVSNQAKNPWIW